MYKMNIEIVKLLYRYRKQIIISTITGLIFGIVLSLMITPKFKSVAVIYPSNFLSSEGVLFSKELLAVNEATNTELLTEYLNSNDLKYIMLKKFNLSEYYELDKNNPKFNYYFNLIFNENFKLSQTKYESIMIEVFDKNPEMAQKFSSGFIEEANSFIRKSVNNSIHERIQYITGFYNQKIKKTDSLKAIIKNLSKTYGLFDYYLQIEQMSRSYYKSIPDNKINNFNPEFSKISENGTDFLELTEEFKNNMLEAVRLKNSLDDETAKLKANISYIKIVSSPSLPSEKDSPKRTLMVILFSIIFFITACLFIIFKEKIQSIKGAIIKE